MANHIQREHPHPTKCFLYTPPMPNPGRVPRSFWNTTDDRGVPRAVHPKHPLSWSVVPSEFVTYAMAWLSIAFVTGVFVVQFTWSRWHAPSHIMGPPWFVFGGLWLMIVLSTGFRLLISLRQRGPMIASLELSHGRCPSCGYDLRPQPAHPDGCTVCPECGAAWRLGQP